MYKNVLNYPDGTAHLAYFEKNPHPDRISDRDSVFYEEFNKKSSAWTADHGSLDFNLVRKYQEPNLPDLDKQLLSLPDVLQKEIDKGGEEGYLKTLTHLLNCFCRYFSTPTAKNIMPGVQWIDYSFLDNYPPAQRAIAELRTNLFNTAAIKNLETNRSTAHQPAAYFPSFGNFQSRGQFLAPCRGEQSGPAGSKPK